MTPKWQLLLEDTSSNPPERLAVNSQTMTIGQAADNDLALADETIAAYQIRLIQQRGQLIIEDLHPATLVNAEPLTGPYALQPNDIIQLGRYKLRVVANQPPPTTPVPLPPPPPQPSRRNLSLWVGLGIFLLLFFSCPILLLLAFMGQQPDLIAALGVIAPTATPSPLINVPTPRDTFTATPLPMATDTVTFTVPSIFIQQAPVDNSRVEPDETVTIRAMAADPSGLARLELWVNGELMDSATNSANTSSMNATLEWTPTTEGRYELELRAQNQLGLSSQLLATTLQVGDNLTLTAEAIPPTETPLPDTPTPLPDTPTPTATRKPTSLPRPRATQPPVRATTTPLPPTVAPTATITTTIVTATVQVLAPTPAPQILRAPEGKTLVLINNRSVQNTPATLTLSQGKSVGGGKQITLDSGQEVQLVLDPDHYHALWSGPVAGFAVDRDITAQAGKIIVMWAIPEYQSTDIEYYDQLTIAAPQPTATPAPSAPLPTAQPGKVLFITANRSFENIFSRLTLTGGSLGGGQEFVIDANTESQLTLEPGDYRAIWNTPGRGGFTAGRDFTVVAGEVILSWIVPENGQVFMQFPGEPPKQINN